MKENAGLTGILVDYCSEYFRSRRQADIEKHPDPLFDRLKSMIFQHGAGFEYSAMLIRHFLSHNHNITKTFNRGGGSI